MTGVCACLRVGGFGWSATVRAPVIWACSDKHLTFMRRGRDKVEEAENLARKTAGALACEYLDHIGKTDLAALTPEEFDMLIRTIVETYRDQMTAACEPF